MLTCCSDRSKYGTLDSRDDVDQLVAEVARIQVEQTDPRHPLADRPHQRHDRPGTELVGAVLAVRRQVLGDEHDLAGAELVDLGEDLGDVAAALLAAERRDRAEPALAVAALGDLDVGPRDRRLRPGQVEQVERRDRRGADRDELAVARRPDLAAGGARATPNPATLVDLGQGGGQLVAVALGHAPGDDEAAAVVPPLVEGEDGVDRLLAGCLDERTRVDDDEVSRLGVVSRAQAVGEQGADELVGVDLVLRATKRLDVEALGHGSPGY